MLILLIKRFFIIIHIHTINEHYYNINFAAITSNRRRGVSLCVSIFPVWYEDETIENPWCIRNKGVYPKCDYLHRHDWLEMIDVLEGLGDNEYNLFLLGADYLRINDLYVRNGYCVNKVGKSLLSIVENKAYENGLKNIFITSATKDADAIRNLYTQNGYGIWTTTYFKRTDIDVRTYDFNYFKYYRLVVIFARYRQK